MSMWVRPFWGWPGWRHARWTAFVALGGTLWFLLIYGGADWITEHRSLRVRIDLPGELALPFVPEAILVYMSIYLLVAGAPFVLRSRRELLALALTLDAEILAAGIVFLLFPVQLAFPAPTQLGALPGLFRFASRLNLTYNLFPSLHVALTVTCVSAFAPRAPAAGAAALWAWAAAVAASTVLTRQHHVADVVAGWALGAAGNAWLYRRLRRPGPEGSAGGAAAAGRGAASGCGG
jgi:membrane-associated phospholipid phosphatase